MKAVLERTEKLKDATVGELRFDWLPNLVVKTLEDPWNNNAKGNSCIPTGVYRVVPHGWERGTLLKKKQTWQLQDVPGRDAILIHSGNSALDTLGCILVGMRLSIDRVRNVTMLFESKKALDAMRQQIGPKSFTLEVRDVK